MDTSKNTAHNHHISALQHTIYAHPHHKLVKEGIGRIGHFATSSQAYPTCHSWIIMAYVSLGDLEYQWKAFNRQLARTQQLLHCLDQQPSVQTHLISILKVELSNTEDIYNSGNNHSVCNKIITV